MPVETFVLREYLFFLDDPSNIESEVFSQLHFKNLLKIGKRYEVLFLAWDFT